MYINHGRQFIAVQVICILVGILLSSFVVYGDTDELKNLHTELESVQKYTPILWLATDERLYPMLPRPFAFDGIDNDSDGFIDLKDPDEVSMGGSDLKESRELIYKLRGLTFSLKSDIRNFPKPRYKITDMSLENLKYEIANDDALKKEIAIKDVAQKLEKIKDQEVIGEKKFVDKLEETIGTVLPKSLRKLILKHAQEKTDFEKLLGGEDIFIPRELLTQFKKKWITLSELAVMEADGDDRWILNNYELRVELKLDESDLDQGRASGNLRKKFDKQGLSLRDAKVSSKITLETGEEIWLITDIYREEDKASKPEKERKSLGKFVFSIKTVGKEEWLIREGKLYLIMKDKGKLRVYDGRRQTYTVTKLEDSFKVTEQSLENLTSKNVPDDVLEKLQSLKNQESTGEETFLDILKRTIGDEQTVRFQSLILEHAKDLTKVPIEIKRKDKLPPPRVVYDRQKYKRLKKEKYIEVYQYWFYYLFDEGTTSHPHDGEHAFVFVDEFGDVRGVVGAGHTEATANNILVVGHDLDSGRQLPEILPKHMPILVELGKHASAPDRSFNGQFDVGIDANLYYGDVWGSRDVVTAFGVDRIRRVASEYSFPRDETTLICEEAWHDARKDIDNDDNEFFKHLTTLDEACMREYKPSIKSKFGEGKEVYQLFPLNDMCTLYEHLKEYNRLKEENKKKSKKKEIEKWLEEHKHCFWVKEKNMPTDFEIDPNAFEQMKKWYQKKEENRDLWEHNDYKNSHDIFKSWLFPRYTLASGLHFESANKVNVIGRVGIKMSDIGSFRRVPVLNHVPLIGGVLLLPYSTLEIFLDYDLRGTELHDLGFVYNNFRGRHQGWYGGLAWGEIGGNDHLAVSSGVSLVWDFNAIPFLKKLTKIPYVKIPFDHTQITLNFGLRGEIHASHDPWQVQPIRFHGQGGISFARLRFGPKNPLTY